MSSGLIGKKVGMTSVFDDDGNNVACTVVEAGPNVVTQVKTEEPDGYNAVQLAFENVKEKNVTQAMLGHFEKAGCPPKRVLSEFRDFGEDVELGDTVRIEDLFREGERIDAVGVS